jgi:hypothetical protein
MVTGLAKTAHKRKMRRLRLQESRLRNRMKAIWGDICELIEAEMPYGYRVHYDWETQGLVVAKIPWLDQLADAQIENDSHWLNDRGLFA